MATVHQLPTARNPVRHHATYRGVPVTARLVPGGYAISAAGYSGTRLVSYRDHDLVLGGLVDLQPTDSRPLWQIVADPATYEGTYGRDMVRGR